MQDFTLSKKLKRRQTENWTSRCMATVLILSNQRAAAAHTRLNKKHPHSDTLSICIYKKA